MTGSKIVTLALLILAALVAIGSPSSSAAKPSHPRIVCGKTATVPPWIVSPKCHVYLGGSK